MKKVVEWILPIKTLSEPNVNDHWTKSAKRSKLQKRYVSMAFLVENPEVSLPCHVKLVRIAPHKVDDDNLVGAMKIVRDSVADNLIPGLRAGRADGDERISWEYGQEKGGVKQYAVKIEILEKAA